MIRSCPAVYADRKICVSPAVRTTSTTTNTIILILTAVIVDVNGGKRGPRGKPSENPNSHILRATAFRVCANQPHVFGVRLHLETGKMINGALMNSAHKSCMERRERQCDAVISVCVFGFASCQRYLLTDNS